MERFVKHGCRQSLTIDRWFLIPYLHILCSDLVWTHFFFVKLPICCCACYCCCTSFSYCYNVDQNIVYLHFIDYKSLLSSELASMRWRWQSIGLIVDYRWPVKFNLRHVRHYRQTQLLQFYIKLLPTARIRTGSNNIDFTNLEPVRMWLLQLVALPRITSRDSPSHTPDFNDMVCSHQLFNDDEDLDRFHNILDIFKLKSDFNIGLRAPFDQPCQRWRWGCWGGTQHASHRNWSMCYKLQKQSHGQLPPIPLRHPLVTFTRWINRQVKSRWFLRFCQRAQLEKERRERQKLLQPQASSSSFPAPDDDDSDEPPAKRQATIRLTDVLGKVKSYFLNLILTFPLSSKLTIEGKRNSSLLSYHRTHWIGHGSTNFSIVRFP